MSTQIYRSRQEYRYPTTFDLGRKAGWVADKGAAQLHDRSLQWDEPAEDLVSDPLPVGNLPVVY
ncbi:MAG: hypothetical protein V3T61_04505 [Acidobacteriota bacterium]